MSNVVKPVFLHAISGLFGAAISAMALMLSGNAQIRAEDKVTFQISADKREVTMALIAQRLEQLDKAVEKISTQLDRHMVKDRGEQ